MGEPRRFKIKRFAPSGRARETRVWGDVIKDGEEIAVREDHATEADIDAVERQLWENQGLDELETFEHWLSESHVDENDLRSVAREILDLVFGEKTPHV